VPHIRSIKPDYFTDADLGELSPLHRLLFAGLWCHADRRGRLKDKPKELKVKILPFDKSANVDEMLAELEIGRFLRRYEVEGSRYIYIEGFEEHQRPNSREPESTLPAPTPRLAHAQADLPPDLRMHAHAQEEGKGREGKGKGREIPDAEQESLLNEQQASEVDSTEKILTHYLTALKAQGLELRATDAKREEIRSALGRGWKPDELLDAINGFTFSDFHMGREEKTRGKTYHELEYCIGTDERIEKWRNQARAA